MSSKIFFSDNSAELAQVLKDNKSIQIVCESNAITEDQFIHKNAEITKLEMCHNTLLKLDNLQPFMALKELCIVNQPITLIENLDQLPHLESLWLAECKIEVMVGLENCSQLKNLYLYSNKIEQIQNIEKLTKLEVLWIGDNKLTNLEGLSTLVNLKSLWVQSNQINFIGSSLENNTKLKELNIASNKLSTFRDIRNIARLSQLTHLWISDPTFGDNPVSRLCNYQTHALAHLRQLARLDGAPVSEDNRKLAEATYTKKKLYYHMRLRTLKRWAHSVVNSAAHYRDEYQSKLHNLLLPVRKEINMLEKIKQERTHNITRQDDRQDIINAELEVVDKKLNSLLEYMQNQATFFKQIENKHTEFDQFMTKYTDTDFARVQLELESGGNIRLEAGTTADSWYSSCAQLTNSRFFSDSSSPIVPTIKVTRVYRVHNRHLRSQFESTYINFEEEDDENEDSDEEDDAKRIEYLFYSDPIEANESSNLSVDAILELGFPIASEYSKNGLGESIPLASSVNLADLSRITRLTGKSVPSTGMPTGKMLIVKAIIGKTMHIRYDPNSTAPSTPTPAPSKSEYQNQSSVFKNYGGEGKQKQWFFFDNAVLLPEYLVEFEYVSKSALLESNLEESDPEPEETRLLNKFKKDCAAVVNVASQDFPKDIIAQEPIVECNKIPVVNITDDWIKSIHANGTSFSSISYLNLSGTSLSRLEGLSLLVNLRILVASFNQIRKIEGLNDLKLLEKLDLSNNQIKRIEGLKGLPLQSLLMHSNFLTRLDDIILLKKYVPDLIELDMRNNPVRRARGYKVLVLRRLSKLTKLDGVDVGAEDQAAALEGTPTLTPQIIKQHSFTRRHGSIPLSEGLDSDDAWMKVVMLNLRKMGIRRIAHLDKLINLRKADLGDNLIGRIEGLENLKQLEDLNLDENCISKVDGLSKLVHLKKLDLGRNQIVTVEGLENLVHLTQLSLEDNLITSLNGLQNLTGLMELYVGNNKVSDRREIRSLRPLERLVILDLSGNDMDSSDSYRLFVVHKLKHLKVLDGLVIEPAEQNASKERFAGRLTTDVLEERVGHISFSSVRALDLGNMKLKDIDPLKGEEFTQLREVTLDHNFLTNAKGFSKLTSLEVLRLNHNRIEVLGLGVQEEEGDKITLPFTRLEVLELSKNCISSIASLHLQAFPNLKILVLSENNITKFDGIEVPSNLQKLVLDKNKIKAVDDSTLTNLTQLSILQLEENFLKVSACFSVLTQLRVLTLGQNRIADILELDRLVLPRLEELTLAGNAVARKLHYRAHAISSNRKLKMLDGKGVTEEERNKAEYLVSSGVVSSTVVLDRSSASSALDSSDPSSPTPPKKVALKPNMIDFGQMLALGVKMEEPSGSSSPKDIPGKPSAPTAKVYKSRAQTRSPSWK